MHARIAVLMALVAAPAALAGRQEAVDLLNQSINTTELAAHTALLEKAVRADPGFFIARHNYGAALYRQGKIDKAVEQLGEALKIDARYPNTHYLLSCCYARLGQSDESMRHLKRAVADGFAEREMMQADTDLDPVRDAKGFRSLEARTPRAGPNGGGGRASRGHASGHHRHGKHHAARAASGGAPPPGHESQASPAKPAAAAAAKPEKAAKGAKPKGK